MNTALNLIGQRLFLVAMCVAFLSPIIGPLLDHHFAERQPDHAHIYLGDRILDHDHSYDLFHSHRQDMTSAPDTRNPESGTIVYLTSDEAASPGFVSLTSVSINTEVVFPDYSDSFLLLTRADQDRFPDGTFLGVPIRPPIA